MYGNTQSPNVATNPFFIKIMNHIVPMAKHITSPTSIANAVTAIFATPSNLLAAFSTINPVTIAVNINPTIYPPVGPAITDGPDLPDLQKPERL